MKVPVIEFKNFGFKYKSQAEPTLTDINLTIYEGEKILIAGPSGSGKSTLAHCINGLVPFSYKGKITGELKVKGKDTKEQGIFALSKIVGTVLQDADGQFIGLTVGEDMAFSLENDCINQKEMKERVFEIAKIVALDGHLNHSLHELSGGQRQRAALGGVLVDQVKILLFDEPLANLDPATGKHAMELINRIHEETNATVLIVEHRIEDVLDQKIDRIIIVNNGRVVCDMSPDEVLASNVLEENNLREPLYVKALKYAGYRITPDSSPTQMERLLVKSCKEKLFSWFKGGVQQESNLKKAPVLELEQIHFQYDDQRKILQDVSFTISKGEMVSIVGKNGAGKSTLSKLICGFEKPDTGRILVDGRDITHDTLKERSLNIGMVLQNPNQMISKAMIYDEVALGLLVRGIPDNEIKERVTHTLNICGLLPFRNWPVSALSYGQKKRVTIASILVLQPDIIILDEPTAGQDYRRYTEIMDFLVKLNGLGVTILIITHDMHLMLEYTPRAIVIANGRVLADDRATKILSSRPVLEQANLKETSLYELAKRAGINEINDFINHFIFHEKGEKHFGR
ncbi:heme ABC transporter ATP-binding protein [Bacillus sp. SA1-12]|uniref:ABC transporter ATP-binding protein n=1 Tax=Bacillus sp. SA1-12 TaxID=1455638 RepID=UPI00062739B6|nr:ABC transporter ATP-binding protein [Bacillus sp. SA1-12]KKI89029.1 heme ABC transporter ATP-binding protein [Bacillus sp. SA1-12]